MEKYILLPENKVSESWNNFAMKHLFFVFKPLLPENKSFPESL